MKLNECELATVLAALRTYQEARDLESSPDVSEHFNGIEQMRDDEIDALCERLNCKRGEL
jgi:hypothetical protein